MRKVDFLEVVLGLERTKMEETKVKVVLNWLVPKSVKDIQKFLELANYYCGFIEEFAKVARLLHKLTRKEQKVGLGNQARKVIRDIKEIVYYRTNSSSSRLR